MVRLGADLNRVRQQVIQLRPGHPAEEPGPGVMVRLEMVEQQLTAVERQLTAIERRAGMGLDISDLDEQEQGAAGHPAPPDLAEQCRQLAAEVERLRSLLRQHGIDPQDKPA